MGFSHRGLVLGVPHLSTGAVSETTNLSIAVSDSPDPVAAGSTITYTITVTNPGPADATTVELTNVIPTGLTFASFTEEAGWTPSTPGVGASGTVTATIASMAAGSAEFTLVLNVPDTYVGDNPVQNTATVTASNESSAGDNSQTIGTTVSYSLTAGPAFNVATDSNIYEDTGGTDACEDDNDSIVSWRNLAAGAQLFAQTTGSVQPHYRTNQQNSLPAAEFDGGDRLAVASSLSPTSSSSTFYAVLKLASSWSIDGTLAQFGDPNAGGNGYRVRVNTNRTVALIGPGGFTASSTGTLALDTWVQITVIHDRAAGTVTFRFNCAQDSQVTGLSTTVTFANTAVSIIGANAVSSPTASFNGMIGQMVHFHAVHSGATLVSNEYHLKNKWGL